MRLLGVEVAVHHNNQYFFAKCKQYMLTDLPLLDIKKQVATPLSYIAGGSMLFAVVLTFSTLAGNQVGNHGHQ